MHAEPIVAGGSAHVLDTVRCTCGSKDLIAVAPGHEAKAFGNNLFTYERGQPVHGWCLRCWPWLRRMDGA